MRNTFEFDLKIGEKYEEEFMQWAVSNNLTIEKMPGLFSEYDFKVTDPETKESLTVELKADRQAIRTNRMALELKKWVGGVYKPSGLSASKADTYVFKIVGTLGFYSIPTAKLRELVEKKTNYMALFTGDNQSSYTALFDKEFLLKHCQRLT